MKQLTLKEIQKIELNILNSFHEYCEQNGLRYSLGGGTLLGAIRHKGFIPWDDDIDVMMPRPDYERFIMSFPKLNPQFDLITYKTVDGYNGLFAKISDSSTVIVDDNLTLDFEIGINIDVFPIDGLGMTKNDALKVFSKTSFDREILNACLWKHFFISKTHSLFFEPVRLILFLISRFVNPKTLLKRVDKVSLSNNFEDSQYAGCVSGSYRNREIMLKDSFLHYFDVQFEGSNFRAIVDYDSYLTKHYGDYMSLPSREKQITHHTFNAYYK